ncbi:ketopantoate reductase family protein [Nesterenkonia alba]|uniref:ketopantoate reductase family protein n=1 Tax=Nesterenkonia alba TaxID=515814 RepID=UPI0003B313E4|nr:2-dehydropantoate 2-reductase N-terminal domain-containing protein [Nesterenkonia alba]
MSIGRIVIIGAGAVGAGTAAELALRGREHLLIGRGEQIRHIAAHGLSYRRPDGVTQVPITTCEGIEAAELQPEDLLIMATKTQHVEEASQQVAWKSVGEGTAATDLPILTLQNGMEAERILLRRFERVYGGSILIPASYTRTGEVISGAAPKIATFVLGRAPRGLDDTAEQIADLLRGIDWLVQTSDDVIRWKARKLLHSVKNGLELLNTDDEARQRAGKALSAEARAVFDAAGIDPADDAERTVDLSQFQVDERSGYSPGQQSTWQSFTRGASSHEADYLNGQIVLLGRELGVPTPVNAALQRALGEAWLHGQRPGEIPAAGVLAAI